MKVLLYSLYHDFVDSIVYKGLVDNIGKNNVFLYADEIAHIPEYANKISKTNIINNVDDNFDCIFFFNTSFFIKNFNQVLNKKTSMIKIFMDGIDDFFVRKIYHHPELNFYFKRELYNKKINIDYKIEWYLRYLYEFARLPNKIGSYKGQFSYWNMPIGIAETKKFKNLKPFPVTSNFYEHRIKKRQVKYDISFIGHNNNPERNRYLKFIEKMNKKRVIHGYLSNRILEKKRYIKKIEESKLGLSLRGVGCSTWRYWEIPSLGTALISQKLPIYIPDDFIDGQSALYFNNYDELMYKIKKYAIDSNEWKEIGKNGYKHFVKYHNPKIRVKQHILNIIK